MKIALCLEYPLGLRGGVSVVVETLATELARHGHKIVIVSPDSAESLQEPKFARFIEQHIYWNPSDSSTASARALAQRLKAAAIDLAHFHAGGTYGWHNRLPFRSPIHHVCRFQIPIFWTSHRAESILDGFCGPQKPLPFKLSLFPIAWLGKVQQLACCRGEIAVSQNNFQKLRRWYAPFRSRFVQIYHSRLHNTALPDSSFRRPSTILTVGHLAEAKGQTILVKAFARIAERHRNFTLLVVGHGDENGTLAQLKKLINDQRLENQVLLLGERNDTEELMRSAAIYVQPSLTEALGLALQEAMFSGCACIGSCAGGIPELIQHEQNGLLVEPGNVEQLARALEELICNQTRREQLGRTAAESVRERGMTAEEMTKHHLELYEAVHRRYSSK